MDWAMGMHIQQQIMQYKIYNEIIFSQQKFLPCTFFDMFCIQISTVHLAILSLLKSVHKSTLLLTLSLSDTLVKVNGSVWYVSIFDKFTHIACSYSFACTILCEQALVFNPTGWYMMRNSAIALIELFGSKHTFHTSLVNSKLYMQFQKFIYLNNIFMYKCLAFTSRVHINSANSPVLKMIHMDWDVISGTLTQVITLLKLA